MVRIVIAEGNTPELVKNVVDVGGTPAAERYAGVVRALDPEAECEILRPYFPDHEPGALRLEGADGVVLTGSGVSWSAADARAAPYCAFVEAAFAAGVPVLGSCWGLQTGAVVLGGAVGESPSGYELGLARHIRPTEAGARHPIHAGRGPSFDAICVHRDEVTRAPEGALVTAANDHSPVQAMVYETGGVRFWGMQYHPELTLGDIANILSVPGRNMSREALQAESEALVAEVAADLRRIDEAPHESVSARWRYGVRPEITDFALRSREIANWLGSLRPEPAA